MGTATGSSATMTHVLAQAIPFVHPGLVLAALGLGLIPILIHLINRRRFVRMPWAAMSFLLAANRRSARRIRVEQWLLLAARVLVIVLLGLALARPYFPASHLLPLRESRVHRVILLDNSLSMNMKTGPEANRFEAARRYAESLLDSFPEQDAVSLVTLARPATAVVAQPAFDRRFVREKLLAVEATQRATDVVGGARLAEEILESGRFAPGNRGAYVIADMAGPVWLAPEGEVSAAASAVRRMGERFAETGVEVLLIHVADEESSNTAITDLRSESALVGLQVPTRLTATVRHFGGSSIPNVAIQIRVDGETVRREELARLAPGSDVPITFAVEFSRAGTHLIEARLAARGTDALPEDDVRYLSVEAVESRPVLLVDGRVSADLLTRQTGFLEKALAPRITEEEPILLAPFVIAETELLNHALDDYDLIVLANVATLPEDTWRRLEPFVREGGGLFLFAGDLLNRDHYTRFGHAGGNGLIPGVFTEPAATVPTETDVGIRPEPFTHPITAEFRDHAEGGLFAARIRRYLPFQVDPRRGEVVLSYSNGDPMLVASSFGKGRVLVCTTTANLDWNNLPAKGDYVALMHKCVAFLAPVRGAHRNLHVGDSVREPLSASERHLPLRIATEDGGTVEPALLPEGDRLVLQYGPVERAGPVKASIGGESRVFAVNVDADESDPRTASVDALRQALGERIRVVMGLREEAEKPISPVTTELGPALLFIVLLLLLVEMWLAMNFGAQHLGKGRTSTWGDRAGESGAVS